MTPSVTTPTSVTIAPTSSTPRKRHSRPNSWNSHRLQAAAISTPPSAAIGR